MKKLFLFLSLALLSLTFINAQKTNLIFFSEQGERFSVILNGILQNPKPETNVKVTDLPAPNYKVKIIFEDVKLGELDKNLMFGQGTETTFCIKKNNKGEYTIRYMNEVPITEAPPTTSGQTSVVYTTTAPPPNTVTHTQTTTTTTGDNTDPNSVVVGINVSDPNGGVNFNMNVNTSDNTTTTSTYSTTTTTTTTTSNSGDYPPTPPPTNNTYVLPGYNGPIGCPYPMTPQDFSSAKSTIASKSFEDSKLSIAKQIINTNCLLSAQVKEIMMLFSFEDTRLDFAKYAYGYTYDMGNYYVVNDAFTFESSIDELNQYTSGFRK